MPGQREKEETMTCKNCGKELEAEEIICTQCGWDSAQEPEKPEKSRINPWKIAFPATVSFGLLLVLGWLLFYGVTGYWIPRANDIHNQDSYSVSEDRLQASRNNVVAKVNGHKLTNAQLQVFYSRACADYAGSYSSAKPLDEQFYDEKTGLTWQKYLLELSLNTWKQYRVLTDLALENGFQLPLDYQKSLDDLYESLETAAEKNKYASVDALLSDDICPGCTYADYRNFVELNYYANLYFEELAAKIEISQEEVETFYEENKEDFDKAGITKESGKLVDIRHIFVKVESNLDETTSDQWKDCKEKAEDILDQWFVLIPSEETFADLAYQRSDDTDSKKNGGLLKYMYKDYLTQVDIRHILIMPEGGTKSEDGKTTVYSDAEWEACRQKAQAVYDEYLNGKKTEEAFGILAQKYSKDGNASEGGIYTDVEKNSMVEAFDEWIFDESRKEGDTGLVKTPYGYHVMYFVHRDDEVNNWAFDPARKYGEYAILKSDTGYHVTFFVEAGETWIRTSHDTLMELKADELLTQLSQEHSRKTYYGSIHLYQ